MLGTIRAVRSCRTVLRQAFLLLADDVQKDGADVGGHVGECLRKVIAGRPSGRQVWLEYRTVVSLGGAAVGSRRTPTCSCGRSDRRNASISGGMDADGERMRSFSNKLWRKRSSPAHRRCSSAYLASSSDIFWPLGGEKKMHHPVCILTHRFDPQDAFFFAPPSPGPQLRERLPSIPRGCVTVASQVAAHVGPDAVAARGGAAGVQTAMVAVGCEHHRNNPTRGCGRISSEHGSRSNPHHHTNVQEQPPVGPRTGSIRSVNGPGRASNDDTLPR